MDEQTTSPYNDYLLERDKKHITSIQPNIGMYLALYKDSYSGYIHLRTHQGSDWATVLLTDDQTYELAVHLLSLIGQKNER